MSLRREFPKEEKVKRIIECIEKHPETLDTILQRLESDVIIDIDDLDSMFDQNQQKPPRP